MPLSKEAHREYMRARRARERAEKAGGSAPGPSSRVAAGPEVSSEPVSAARAAGRASGVHRKAVTRMLRSTGLLHIPEEAPLVELVKSLAGEMDAGGGSRTVSAYIAALRDVRRVLAVNARPSSSPDVPAPSAEEEQSGSEEAPAPVNSLAAFRQARGIG